MMAAMATRWSVPMRCWAAMLVLSLVVRAVAQQTKVAPADSAAYLQAEHTVRHEFVQRYPLLDQAKASLGPRGMKNKGAAGLFKTIDGLPDDQKFGLVFAYVMQGRVEAKKSTAAPPTYWQRQLGALMATVPLGGEVAKPYLAQNESRAARENDEAPNRLALKSMQTFRALIVGYGMATGEEFDQAAPLARTRLILRMFAKAQGDIGLPCPFSIFLLDMDAADADSPPMARETVGRLLGKSSAEYLHFPEFSREQRSLALKQAHLHLLEEARKVAAEPSIEALNRYLLVAGMSCESGSWSVQEESGKAHAFAELMRVTLGDAEVQKFSHEAEGPAKDANRVAVLLLWAQYHLGTSGWLIG